ncbi:MAG: SMC family ATPase [Anaerolineae bacterium]|nr:SMC family ATPase [Anaerolineae bacterium]
MIPIRLQLTNFLSYRGTTELDFDGLDLTCIAGHNGAGKSSLLDAMTWALFGRSRSKSDDDVVNRIAGRNGEQAEVRFEFLLEGDHYRVMRQKQPGRTTSLELQICAGDGDWRTLSEPGVRATQTAIEQLLRMNYDTFVNASFFLQGRADEFTTKTPGKRKEILAELLGVNRWDSYRDAVHQRLQLEEGRRAVIDAQIEAIELELAKEAERCEALAEAEARHAALAAQREVKEKLVEQMRHVQSAIVQQKQQVKNLHAALVRGEARLAELEQASEKRRAELAQAEALLQDAPAIRAGYEAWQVAEREWKGWQEKADAYHALQRERRPHELAVESARSRLQQQQQEHLARQAEVAAMAGEQTTLAESIAETRAALAKLEAQRSALAAQQDAFHDARAALQKLESQRQLWQQEQKQLDLRRREVNVLQQAEGEVRANREQAEQELARLDEKAVQLAQQREQYARALGDLDRLRNEQPALEEQMKRLRQRIDQLEDEAGGSCPTCGQPLTETHRQEVLAAVQEEGKEHGDRWRTNKEKIAALEQEIPVLERAIRDGERLDRERRSQEQRLAAATARLEETARKVEAWQAEDEPRLGVLAAKLADTVALVAQQGKVQELGKGLEERPALETAYNGAQRQLSDAEARLASIEKARESWETEGSAALAAITARLEANDLAPGAQAALASLDEKMATLGYDEAAHAGARQTRDELEEAPQRYQALVKAEAAVRPVQESLADLEAQLRDQQAQVVEARAQHEAAAEALAQLEDGAGDVAAAEQELFDLREQEIAAARRVGAVQQSLAVLEDQRKRKAELQEEGEQLNQLIRRLDLLKKSCGRDGVQALLIEQALPEIETDANDLLERLSNGEMRITFETQKALKSRDELAETLDITISDNAGDRPYENFSGGEQFRVNFAVRLALSRILTRRAGARLQTLVVDEGFGSQDTEGQQRLVEAINVIRDDFARILVITHLSELQDAFPRRIQVQKGPAGSQLTVF